MADMCGDNRFEIIEAAKRNLIEATNIETSPEEMAVLDNILFRMWQMDWLPVHAHWVEDDDGVHCSKCKKDAPLEVFTYSFHPATDSWDGDVKFNKSEFCPHCGAAMDETEVAE